jgi:hypothetical protein
VVQKLEEEIVAFSSGIQYMNTPYEVCKRYLECERAISTAINKKKKELQKELQEIKENHKTVLGDIERVREIEKKEKELKKEKGHLEYLENYMKTQIEKVCIVLKNNGFLLEDDNSSSCSIRLSSPLGEIAANIAEVHPLVWSSSIASPEEWNYFEGFSVRQIIGLLSCCTDIKVSQEYRLSVPNTSDKFLQKKITDLVKKYQKYEDIENETQMRTGIHYENILMFDIIDETMEWCDCVDEPACKWFIQTKLQEKEIAVGDFAKGMLKIATMAHEFANIPNAPVEYLHKLSLVDGLVLKYIATSQSLYV